MALDRDSIVTTTLELIDADGLGAASMRAIGGRLGVAAMALYKYFPTRDDLLDAVVDRIVSELDDAGVPTTAEDGWRSFLYDLAHGVRRYARAHPHAFPLVTTRPATAPWVNPPLRSLVWIERLLAALSAQGFDDDSVLFTYRSFNSFLLGYLLLETGALTLTDPQPGDGSYAPDADATEPVPGGLTPTRTDAEEDQIADADRPVQLLDPAGDIDAGQHPNIHRLAPQLAEEHFDDEFDRALNNLLDLIGAQLSAA